MNKKVGFACSTSLIYRNQFLKHKILLDDYKVRPELNKH